MKKCVRGKKPKKRVKGKREVPLGGRSPETGGKKGEKKVGEKRSQERGTENKQGNKTKRKGGMQAKGGKEHTAAIN